MARKSSIEKNNKKRRKVASLRNKRAQMKAQIYDKNLSLEDRFPLVMALAKLPRSSSQTRIRNMCELTGRSRGYYRKFKLSRIMLRELAGKGLVPGLIKASW